MAGWMVGAEVAEEDGGEVVDGEKEGERKRRAGR